MEISAATWREGVQSMGEELTDSSGPALLGLRDYIKY